MAKKVKTIVKINLKGAEATPAPPVGTALGQHGIAIMDFVRHTMTKPKTCADKCSSCYYHL
jgi:ribosomal protein L11